MKQRLSVSEGRLDGNIILLQRVDNIATVILNRPEKIEKRKSQFKER